MSSPHPELIASAGLAADIIDKFLCQVGGAGVLDLEDAAYRLRTAIKMPPCPTPWPWLPMGDASLVKVKEDATRVMLFVPKKRIVTGAEKQHFKFQEAKLVLGQWTKELPVATPAHTPGRFSAELVAKHGGYWAADRRGVKPISGAPELWCWLPVIERVG